MRKRLDIAARTVMVLLVALTVFTPVAAQAACASTVCSFQQGQACGSLMVGEAPACCTSGAPMMSGHDCGSEHERPTFVSTVPVPDLAAPAQAVGVAAALTNDSTAGRTVRVAESNLGPPTDPLAGTRLRI